MKVNQHTIKAPCTISGVGLHTGIKSVLTFIPAPPNAGISFRRTDLLSMQPVTASLDHVVDLNRGTTIEFKGVRIHTIEHVLAAVAALEIDNLIIELSGPEPPIMDGSSRPFMDLLLNSGIQDQNVQREFIELEKKISYSDEDKGIHIMAEPHDGFSLNVEIDFNSPVLGTQQAVMSDLSSFYTDFSDARTFCFLHEIEPLFKSGLIKGGDLSNAIVIVDNPVSQSELENIAKILNKEAVAVRAEGILNNTALRNANEPARHKLLDMIGDLTLLGRPLKAKITATRPGHAANYAFAKMIEKVISTTETAPIEL
jgi:UDP-3-O-[3-hydroxymyristoyl] N-acetylglucosamine deacetylase/3-hydroxyacyl-[acyl-carrier-protein] dehydratase